MESGYSYTSNVAKLLKHLDKLKGIQNGIISPIMIHSIPTHKCNLNCVHCCFKNRKDKSASIDLNVWSEGIKQFREIGTTALEFTGGGDPTLWPPINEAITFAYDIGYHIGLITNGIDIDRIEVIDKLDWVRVSLNTLDYKEDIQLNNLLNSKAEVSFCYIWNENSDYCIGKIVEFANTHEIVCRLAPDCIKPIKDIEKSLVYIRKKLDTFKSNNYVFLSDFNVDTVRNNDKCFIHMIKPCFYIDGYVYACPSAELAIENNRQIQYKTQICYYKDIKSFYTSTKASNNNNFSCSYCKYTKQQELLENLLMETSFNDFA